MNDLVERTEDLERTAHAMGFESAAELFRLIASLNLSIPETNAKFQYWKMEDGTKAGFVKSFPLESNEITD